MLDFEKLRPLNRELLPPEVNVSIRELRRRAKKLGQCYVISRKVLVSEEQLAAIIESYRVIAKDKDPRVRGEIAWRVEQMKRGLKW